MDTPSPDTLVPIGTVTPHGTVQGYRFDGERYYFLIDEDGTVSYMPAIAIETPTKQPQPT